jgi:DNA-directed RNA polymerase specialized sigma24 family protein
MKCPQTLFEQLLNGRLSDAVASQEGLCLLRRLSSVACARLGLPAEDVEDLAQDVVCRLLEVEARSALRGDAPMREENPRDAAPQGVGDESANARRKRGRLLYLRQVTRNLAVDHVRRRATAKRAGDLPAATVAPDSTQGLERLADRSPSPEERLLSRERRRQFLRLCDRHLRSRRLRRRDLEIVRLAWLDGLSSREIARGMRGALDAASIDSLLCRLRRRMRAAGTCVGSRRCMA